MSDPLEQLLLAREEAQAPATTDPLIQRAIQLLTEQDRPAVPVNTYKDPKQLFKDVLQKFGGPELSPNAVGVVPFDKKAIYINQKSAEYRDPYKLASKIAHETIHTRAANWDRREYPAYEKELEFIDSNPMRFDTGYRNNVNQLVLKLKKDNK